MKKKNNKYLIILLIALISVGFAFLSTTLEINGSAGIRKNTWKIYFDNVVNLTGQELATVAPTTTGTATKKISYNVSLNEPRDEYRFNVDIVNDGTLNAMIKVITNSSLTEEQKKYIDYKVTYSDETELSEKNLLAKQSRETLLVSVIYKRNISANELPSIDENINLDLKIEYEQADSTAVARSTNQLNVKYDYNFNMISDFEDKDMTNTSRANYSIKNNVIEITANQDDGYVILDKMVKLEKDHNYYISAEIDGEWGKISGEDTQEIFFISEQWLGRDMSVFSKDIYTKERYFTNNLTDNYHVRFDCNKNGATHHFWNIFLTEYTESAYDVGANLTLPTPTRDGYNFMGWFTERVGGTQVTTSTKVNYSTIYYAHWTEA